MATRFGDMDRPPIAMVGIGIRLPGGVEDAGQPLEVLAQERVGVYVGGFTHHYGQMLFSGGAEGRAKAEAHTSTGIAMTMLSNRVFYVFGFTGPSMSVDTACSSSLVALDPAAKAIQNDDTDAALVGGVNAMISPNFTIAASQGGFLSPTSTSRPFDASANGYVRGEGAGIVLLRRLDDALRDGQRIHAIIRGTAITQDGRTNGITVPNPRSQTAAMLRAMDLAEIRPEECCYVEAHGTGTPVGDPIEARAVSDAYVARGIRDDALLISSVKGNIGHLEAAAGVASLVKAVLCLENRSVPPQAGLSAVNPELDLKGRGLRLPFTQTTLRPTACDQLIIGVNSFGFGGTNAHAVLQEAPVQDTQQAHRAGVPRPLLLPARTQQAGRNNARLLADHLASGADPDETASALITCRTHHPQFRAVAIGNNTETLCGQVP